MADKRYKASDIVVTLLRQRIEYAERCRAASRALSVSLSGSAATLMRAEAWRENHTFPPEMRTALALGALN